MTDFQYTIEAEQSDPKRIPVLGKQSFACPRCGAFSHHDWYDAFAKPAEKNKPYRLTGNDMAAHLAGIRDHQESLTTHRELCNEGDGEIKFRGSLSNSQKVAFWAHCARNISFSQCKSCHNISVWKSDKLLFPENANFMKPHPDMPQDVRYDFIEASDIITKSPRAAAALLRLCVQKLCAELGLSGKNINQDISDLVARGLPVQLQKALDTLRVIGNNAVHPGQLDLNDNASLAHSLFWILNFIVEKMISEPKKIDEIYRQLPASSIEAIGLRDAKIKSK